jgi:hypothetical protein
MNIESALNSLRLLRVAEESYRFKLEHHRYGTLEELYNAGLIDAELGSGTKDGYRFELAPLEISFKLTAIPNQYGRTGDWSFYLDESGVIRGQTSNRDQMDTIHRSENSDIHRNRLLRQGPSNPIL